jgi:hypothetical protein
VFHEDPVDVVWKFSPKVAADAAEFLFHPSQSMDPQPDGSLVVRFRAGVGTCSPGEMRWKS